MGEPNVNSVQDAPPQQDRTVEAPDKQGTDRIEVAERGQMQSEDNSRDVGTNRPADARGEDQHVEAHRGDDAGHPARVDQQAEREAITTLPDRVGFQFDSSKADRSEVKRVLDNLSPEQQVALKDPTATVILTGSASRAGGAEHNMDLSQDRAENVAALLKEMGVVAQIAPLFVGEQEAKGQGQADGVDDRDFRSVKIDVLPGQYHEVEEQTKFSDAQAAKLAQTWTDQVPDLSKVDTIKEFIERGQIALRETVEVVKDVASERLDKALVKIVEAELGMFADSLAHRDYRANVSLNLIPAFLQAFDKAIVGDVHSKSPEVIEHPGAYRSAESKAEAIKAVRNGALLLQKVLDTKSPTEINEMKQAARDMANLTRLHREFERVLHHKLNH